ncbi:hypothetical protein BY996DRAFT_6602131 [Phakopsora pachyrhizi]|nr:hypothetical protein BY996DRAFT_6602131 [Phakopsora pachyrhizi]
MTRAWDDFDIEEESIKRWIREEYVSWLLQSTEQRQKYGIWTNLEPQIVLISNHHDNNKRNSQRALEQEQKSKRLKMVIQPGLQNFSVWGLREFEEPSVDKE